MFQILAFLGRRRDYRIKGFSTECGLVIQIGKNTFTPTRYLMKRRNG